MLVSLGTPGARVWRFLAGERVYFGYVNVPSSPAVRLVSTS